VKILTFLKANIINVEAAKVLLPVVDAFEDVQ
jgi:hypothetical protein